MRSHSRSRGHKSCRPSKAEKRREAVVAASMALQLAAHHPACRALTETLPEVSDIHTPSCIFHMTTSHTQMITPKVMAMFLQFISPFTSPYSANFLVMTHIFQVCTIHDILLKSLFEYIYSYKISQNLAKSCRIMQNFTDSSTILQNFSQR